MGTAGTGVPEKGASKLFLKILLGLGSGGGGRGGHFSGIGPAVVVSPPPYNAFKSDDNCASTKLSQINRVVVMKIAVLHL